MSTKKRKAKKSAGKSAKTTKSAKAAKSAGKAKAPPRMTARAAMSVATSSRRGVEERVAALAESPVAASDKGENLQAVLNVLSNKEEPAQVRLAAIRTLQAASFASLAFDSIRGDYIAALRQAAQDPDEALRRRALGVLAREKDGFAQKKLLEGLQNPEKALVPPEKALQLLGNDVHAEAYSAAREIVNKPPNTAAKREALRLLAADAASAPVFEKVLRDKSEQPELRRISAAALHMLKPKRMQEHAREILLDPDEQDELQAASLTAITQFGDPEAVAQDETLRKRVDKLSTGAATKVKQSARDFIKKFSG